jgi:hypothetical protein
LFYTIKDYLIKQGTFEEKKEKWQQAYDRNKEMNPLIVQHDVIRIKGFLTDAGFDLVDEIPSGYVDCVIMLKAVKTPDPQEWARPARPGEG